MCKVIAIANQKGGVGKTTTTANLGVSLGNMGKKVLLIDLDGQANLTMSFGIEPDELEYTISELIEKRVNSYNYQIDRLKYTIEVEGIDIIPSDIRLSSMETKMVNTINRESILKNIIQEFEEEYEYILIDCAPSLSIITINALVSADSIIIPVQSHFLALKGMEDLMQTIGQVKTQINPNLKIEGILLTMFDKRTRLSKEIETTVRDIYSEDIKVFQFPITIATKIAEAPSQGKSIFAYDPNSDVATCYEILALEVVETNEEVKMSE